MCEPTVSCPLSACLLLCTCLRLPQEERGKVRDLFLYSRAHLRADAPLPPPEELPDCPVDCECAGLSVGATGAPGCMPSSRPMHALRWWRGASLFTPPAVTDLRRAQGPS